MRKLFYSFFTILLLLSVKSFTQNDPVSVFNQVWHAYDTLYSGFAHKDIDWDKLYKIYRPKINENTSENELFDITTQMLRHLNDNHVQIAKENPERHFSAGLFGYLFDDIGFDSTLSILSSLPVSDKYFKDGLNCFNKFTYGWLQDSIGYFHFGEFKDIKATQDAMDTIIQYFSASKAMIIDVRRNTGGEDKIGKLIAMAMREIPHVKIVGDYTSGAYADSEWRMLPCGWNLCIPYSIHTDKNEFCWEGIGIPPDYRLKKDPTKPITEKDELIEFSLELINN